MSNQLDPARPVSGMCLPSKLSRPIRPESVCPAVQETTCERFSCLRGIMSLLTGTHIFQDQVGVTWVLNEGTLRITFAGRQIEDVFKAGESRMGSTGVEEYLLYTKSEGGYKERLQIRSVGAEEYVAELRINVEPLVYELWELEALFRLTEHKSE